MNGILVVDKPKGITSREVVNKIVKKFNIKKVGHTGTLDPIATGVLVICIGRATKLVDDLTSLDKEYIASVELGTLTDTLDLTGNVLKEEPCLIKKNKIIDALSHFKGKYVQEVPIYSAVKVNGKKLYEYAREELNVELPKREVEIFNIELLSNIEYKDNKTFFKFKCKVSKGTYIRALINDIAKYLETIGIMTDLRRTRQGKFKIEDAHLLDKISIDNVISIKDVLDIKEVELTEDLEKKVLNGNPIPNIYKEDVLFVKDNEAIALYKQSKDKLIISKMLKGGIL